MENSKKQNNEIPECKVFPIKNLSDSDLTVNHLTVCPNDIDNDLRIVGFKVQLDDDQVYSFILDKARSKSTDVLSILSGSNDPIEYHQVENETKVFSCIPEDWEMTSKSQEISLRNEEDEERFKNSSALELKIGLDCLENNAFELHIKSKNDSDCVPLMKDQQPKEIQESDQEVDAININRNNGGSHCVTRYFQESAAIPLECITEIANKEITTEKKISASAEIGNLKTMNSKSAEVASNKLQNSSESKGKTIKSSESKTNYIFTKHTGAHKDKFSQTENTAIFSTDENCNSWTQTKKIENVATFEDFNDNLVYEDVISEKSTDTEDLLSSSLMIAEEVSAEHQTEDSCQCWCGHKKQHDCIYLCCYHRDCENTIPTSILLGQNPGYLSSKCSTFQCEYCRCRLNRCCSETTKNCAEKLKSDIHPKYCCKCGIKAPNVKNASASMVEVKKLENPESIEISPKTFNSLSACKEKTSHKHQLQISKSLESTTEKENAQIAVKVSRSPKIEKVRCLDLPLVKQYCLNKFTLLKLGRPKFELNPVEMKLCEKEISVNSAKELKLKSNVDSVEDKIKESRLPIYTHVEKKSVLETSALSPKLDSFYSHSQMCPYSICHSSVKAVQSKTNGIILNSCGGVFSIVKSKSSENELRSTSPLIKSDDFDYISKEGWKPYNVKKDQFISKKTEAADITHLEKSCDKRFQSRIIQGLNDACEIVNDHLLSLRPIDEDKVRKTAEILHRRWFEEVGSKNSDLQEVRNYIQYFKEFSNNLLKTLLYSVDNNGNNVLHFAFANNRFDLADEILQNGFALDLLKTENKSGNTPLMICAISQPDKHSDWTVIRKCFELSNVNEKSVKIGQTSLMNAASCGFRAMVDLLLDIGADPNLQDVDGSTALMYAAEHGHEKCVKSLVRHKICDPTIRDKDGETACSIALSNGHKNIAVLIHMQALEKRRLSKNMYSTKRFIWTNNTRATRVKTGAMVTRSTTTDL